MDTSTAVLEDTEEQQIDKALTEYGFEEQGMSLDEKKSLLLVLKNSESTALAEEHSRVGIELPDTSNSDLIQSDCDVIQSDSDPKNNTDEKAALDCNSDEEASSPASTQPCNVVDNVTNDDNDDSDDSNLPKQKGVTFSLHKFTPKRSRLSLNCRPTLVGDGDENVDAYNLLSKSSFAKSKSPLFEDRLDDTNTKTEMPSRPTKDSTCLKSDLPLSIRNKKEDRKRNIDVFNAVKDRNEHPLTINKQFKINGKTPYYVVPHGMDCKEFTIYFNEQLAAMATNLNATQRRSLKLVPWGDPVVASNLENNNCTFEEVTGPADNDNVADKVGLNAIAQNQRYNFRGRSNKRKCDDNIFNYKLSDEEDSEDEDLFIKRPRPKLSDKNKIPPYSGSNDRRKSVYSEIGELLGEKEVNLSTGDTFISNKEMLDAGDTKEDSASENETKKTGNTRVKNICKSGISKTKETGKLSPRSHLFQPLQILDNDDDDKDYEVGQENKTNKRKLQKPNNKSLQQAKTKKKISKPLEHGDSQGEEENGVGSGDSKRPNWLNTTLLNDQKDDGGVIKPLPVNPKMRKLTKPNSASGKTRKKVTKPPNSQKVDEPTLSFHDEETDGDIHVGVGEPNPCPMCKQMFDLKKIEAHAADCNGVEDSDPGKSIWFNETPTSRCPICVESFPTGPNFDSHAKTCRVTKRLVIPPGGPSARNRSKR